MGPRPESMRSSSVPGPEPVLVRAFLGCVTAAPSDTPVLAYLSSGYDELGRRLADLGYSVTRAELEGWFRDLDYLSGSTAERRQITPEEQGARFRSLAKAVRGGLAQGDPVFELHSELVPSPAHRGDETPSGLGLPFDLASWASSLPKEGPPAWVHVGPLACRRTLLLEAISRYWRERGASRFPQARRLWLIDRGPHPWGGPVPLQEGWVTALGALAGRFGLKADIQRWPPGIGTWLVHGVPFYRLLSVDPGPFGPRAWLTSVSILRSSGPCRVSSEVVGSRG